jgi:hypothetical protein
MPAATDFHAFADDRLGEERLQVVVPSPATSAGPRGNFAHHLRAHILELVLELDLLGDGDAVRW